MIFKVYDTESKGKVGFKDLLEVLQDLTGSFMSEMQREVPFPSVPFPCFSLTNC